MGIINKAISNPYRLKKEPQTQEEISPLSAALSLVSLFYTNKAVPV
ncbi:MAG: hypothetical protein RHS_2334 [Robinsoniella sp. RHS]|nr:MAG: hypothetical protein RHS_2334 [Robinsoniella sp. RHS]